MRPAGISVEARLAPLTLTALGVVQTVARAAAALAGLAPRRPVKVAAESVAVTLALWREREEDIEASAPRADRRYQKLTFIRLYI